MQTWSRGGTGTAAEAAATVNMTTVPRRGKQDLLFRVLFYLLIKDTSLRSSTRNLRTAPNRTTLRYRGRNPRPAANDLRNNLRNNHALSTVSREEETYKVTIPMTDAYDTLYLMNLIKEHLDDSNIVFYNVSSASVSTEQSIFLNHL